MEAKTWQHRIMLSAALKNGEVGRKEREGYEHFFVRS